MPISFTVNETELQFEHSLVSLSTWESTYEKPFFNSNSSEEKTMEEMLSYFQAMLISPKDKPHLLMLLSDSQHVELVNYMQRNSTATTIREIQTQTGRKENLTSELIYYWLTHFRIPFEPTDTWHLNRLLMLVRVCSAKNTPPKKQTRQSRAKQAQDMRALNEQRLKAMGTSG